MSKTDHFPGPWRAEGTTVKAITHGHWFALANTRYPKFTQEGQEANARLIAAAPLLLEAVELFMAQYGGDSPERATRPEQVAARAALALVEGK